MGDELDDIVKVAGETGFGISRRSLMEAKKGER